MEGNNYDERKVIFYDRKVIFDDAKVIYGGEKLSFEAGLIVFPKAL